MNAETVSTGNVTDGLASFVADLTYSDIPTAVRERVKDILLDTIASALAGRGGEEAGQIERLARAVTADAGGCTVIGGEPAAPAAAVLVNGYLVTAATVCDVHRATLCHVTPEVVPPAMAAAELRGASGRDFLAALAAGLEVTTRVGLGTHYEAFRARGWHSPGVIGPFGGASSAGKLLGLDRLRQRNALALAGSQSAGTFAHWGTPTIKFHQSRGALSGLLAAFLAETGFSGATDILGAPDGGLLRTYSDGGDPEAIVDGLGERWELLEISLRRWPVASSIQSMVTALFSILDREALDPAQVRRVEIGLSDTAYRMHGELGWDSRFRALLSTRYVASVVVHDRRCWLDQFTPERIADPALDAFAREAVAVSVDDSLPTNGATVTVESRDGQRFGERRDVPKGDALDPLSRDEIRAKLDDAANGTIGGAVAKQLANDLIGLERLEDVQGLFRNLRSRVPSMPAAAPR